MSRLDRSVADVIENRAPGALLDDDDPSPVTVTGCGAASPFLLVCDHAGRAVPRALAGLGLSEALLGTHIGWDIGALGLAQDLATRLGAPLIAQPYSRLVIDCNRAPGQAGSIAAVSDGVVIPGNQNLTAEGATRRLAEIHRPYHDAIAVELDARAARAAPTLMICVHSFTPAMQGISRPWHVGVLHGGASPASNILLALLRGEPGLVVGDNEPYAMDGTDYTAPHHAWARGLDVIELEIRQDLLVNAAGQGRFAELFARLLPPTLPA